MRPCFHTHFHSVEQSLVARSVGTVSWVLNSSKVKVLDADGKTIPGFEKEASMIEGKNAVKLPIRWKNAAALPASIPIRLRFHLQNGALFSYRID